MNSGHGICIFGLGSGCRSRWRRSRPSYKCGPYKPFVRFFTRQPPSAFPSSKNP
jgi:hypothetical protein